MDLVIRPLITADVDEVVAFSVDAWGPVFASVEQVLGHAVFLQVYPDWLMSHAEFVRGVCLGDKARAWVADVDFGQRPYGRRCKTDSGDIPLARRQYGPAARGCVAGR